MNRNNYPVWGDKNPARNLLIFSAQKCITDISIFKELVFVNLQQRNRFHRKCLRTS